MSTTYGSFLQWVTAIIKKHEDGDLDDRKWMLRVNGTLVSRYYGSLDSLTLPLPYLD